LVYLRKYLGKNPFFKKNLNNLKYAFSKKDNSLMNEEITCIIPTFNEELLIKYAIESSRNFVTRYIIIDKDGSTVPKIKETRDEYDLDIKIYVKPDFDRRKARAYAASIAKTTWILLQDGDEIFYNEGVGNIENLRILMNRPNILYCAPKVLLWGSLKYTNKVNIIMPPHPLLYHNNGSIRPREDNLKDDIPDIDAWRIGLPHPFVFNCRLKGSQDDKRIKLYDPDRYFPYPSMVIRMMKEMDPKYV